MGSDKIIEQIISSRRDLTREIVLRLIEEKKIEADGYFTDEGAARVVASELGVEILQKSFQLKIMIQDLVSGLNDVTITGRVIIVHPPQNFTRSFDEEGKVARLLIADKSGILRAVLWDDKVSFVEDKKIKQGQIIRILHGYVREGLDGELEIHVGSRGSIQVSPPITNADYPTVSSFLQKISEIKPGMQNVKTLSRVAVVGGVREFKRNNGDLGCVSTLLLTDETGFLHLNLWEEKARLSNKIRLGDIVLVEGAYARERFGEINLNIGKHGILTLNPENVEAEKIPLYEEKIKKISELTEEGGPITVVGTIATTPNIREVTTKRGERVSVASFMLENGSGGIRVSLWRGLVNLAKDLTIGKEITIRNAYARRGLGNALELSSRMLTSLEIN